MPFHPDQLLLYAVTDRAWTGRQTLLEQLEAALQGGVTLVQLREKDLDPAAFLAEALEVKALCRRYHVPLILNDQVDLALACGADGVHVGSEDKPGAQRLTPEELGGICASVSIPAVAIGGIGPSNLAQLKGSGAAGIAVVSSLFGAEDIQAAAQALARQARQVLFPHPIP